MLSLLAWTLALIATPLAAEKPQVQAKLIAPAQAPTASKQTVTVEMTIGSKWHVNSHTPSETYLIPTDVALKSSAGALSPVRYPRDIEKRFSFSDKPLRVYEGTVRFEVELEIPAAAAGPLSVAGTVSYQACDDQQCYAPAKISVEASIVVSTPAAKPR